MAKGVKYLIMTIIFLGITKLLQVTSFDGEKYAAMEKKRYGKYINKDSGKAAKDKPKKVTKLGKPAAKPTKNSKQASSKKENTKKETEAGKALSKLKESYLTPLLEKLPPDGLRKDIFIRYYRHNQDGIGVYKLEEMGYYMHQKPATETAGLGSNIIYYGDDVPLEDIQIVALTLLEEGIPLKTIQHTKFEWKSSAIEIGTDSSLQDQPNIALEEILDFDKQYLGSSY